MPQVPPLHPIHETSCNLIAENTKLTGEIEFEDATRFHGELIGKLIGRLGAKIILGEASTIEGQIEADEVLVCGYVKGSIKARSKILLSRTARVFGDLLAPSIAIEPGALFEGRSKISEPKLQPILDPQAALS